MILNFSNEELKEEFRNLLLMNNVLSNIRTEKNRIIIFDKVFKYDSDNWKELDLYNLKYELMRNQMLNKRKF